MSAVNRGCKNVLPRCSDSRNIRIYIQHFHLSATKIDNRNHSLKILLYPIWKLAIEHENYVEEITLQSTFSCAEDMQNAYNYENNKNEPTIVSEVKTVISTMDSLTNKKRCNLLQVEEHQKMLTSKQNTT